ncbi:MAG TPA: PIN domain-containing protein [Blastocatellia bacterium]|nr:PIN domain-containing protein [Blastocatellia bacterium]
MTGNWQVQAYCKLIWVKHSANTEKKTSVSKKKLSIKSVMKFAFLDTQIFLHYRFFDEIDWAKIVGSASVRLVVAPIVIRELDKHKNTNPRQKIRERSAKVIRKFHEICDKETIPQVRPSVEMEVILREPPRDIFTTHNLDVQWQDDWLLASILYFQQENLDASVTLITQESLLPMKAKSLGLAVISLPDDFKIVDGEDANEKRIKQLEQENRELKFRSPEIKISFDGDVEYLTVSKSWPIDSFEKWKEEELLKLKNKYQKYEIKAPPLPSAKSDKKRLNIGDLRKITIDLESAESSNEPSLYYKREYNRKLDEFWAKYEEYLERLRKVKEAYARMVPIDLVLRNTGTLPAEDIDIYIYFPDYLANALALRMPEYPKALEPPDGSGNQDGWRDIYRSQAIYPVSFGASLPVTPNVRGPFINSNDSSLVTFSVGKLKHNHLISLDTVYVVFNSIELAKSFTIQYRLTASNVLSIVSRELHVKVGLLGSNDKSLLDNEPV